MIINELLLDKYRVQKALDQEVGHSLQGYVAETHNRVKKLSETHGLVFHYGSPGADIDENKLSKTINTDT